MAVYGAPTIVTVAALLLAVDAGADRRQDRGDNTPRHMVLQGCITVAGDPASSGRPPGSAPAFILSTAPDSGQRVDRSVNQHGQSGQTAGQQQTPTGQQTQAGQEPSGPVGSEATTDTAVRRFRLTPATDSVNLARYVGRQVELQGHASSAPPGQRRHDGQPDSRGIADPLTGMPGPGDQAGQPAPHYTSPGADGDISGTLTVTSVRALSAPCTEQR